MSRKDFIEPGYFSSLTARTNLPAVPCLLDKPLDGRDSGQAGLRGTAFLTTHDVPIKIAEPAFNNF
jgi:hypothetical protein